MAIENSVSNIFLYAFNSFNVFDCRLSGVVMKLVKEKFSRQTLRKPGVRIVDV